MSEKNQTELKKLEAVELCVFPGHEEQINLRLTMARDGWICAQEKVSVKRAIPESCEEDASGKQVMSIDIFGPVLRKMLFLAECGMPVPLNVIEYIGKRFTCVARYCENEKDMIRRNDDISKWGYDRNLMMGRLPGLLDRPGPSHTPQGFGELAVWAIWLADFGTPLPQDCEWI